MKNDRYKHLDEFSLGSYHCSHARDSASACLVRFKTAPASALGDSQLQTQLKNQAASYEGLDHPGIVGLHHYYEQGELSESAHLITLALDGDIKQLFSVESLSLDAKLELCRQLLQSLNHCHQNGLLNLQLSDQSLEISGDYQILKIADLGIGSDQIGELALEPDYQYAAPELFDPAAEVGPSADVYSAGLLCLKILCGATAYQNLLKDIFSGSSESPDKERFLNWHLDMSRELPAYDQNLVPLPEAIYSVIRIMCAKRSSDRYRDISEVIAAFARATGSSSWQEQVLTPMAPEALVLEPIKPGKKTWTYAVVGGVLAIVIGAVGFFMLRPADMSVLDDEVAAAQAARTAAELAGAQVLSIPEYTKGGELYALAKTNYDKGNVSETSGYLSEATAAFNASLPATATALKLSLTQNMDNATQYVDRLRPDGAASLLDVLSSQYQKLDEQVGSDSYKIIRTAEAEAVANLRDGLATLPVYFEVGSTREEVDEAINDCMTYSSDCPESWYETELLRERLLRPFELDNTEVSVAQFREFTGATGYKSMAETMGYSYVYDGQENNKQEGLSWRSPFSDAEPAAELPAMHISVDDAKEYCAWAGKRLPTESEWEFASRGPDRNAYIWGNTWDSANVPDFGSDQPSVVSEAAQGGFFPGLTGLTGNVWEWVTLDGDSAGLKGGSFLESAPTNLRSAARRDEAMDVVNSDDGFRCAKSVERWPENRGGQKLTEAVQAQPAG
ncbi:MAG: sulfatase modifying factor 1 [Halioglobus sp.]|jgi:sulfatase modifying factor 1